MCKAVFYPTTAPVGIVSIGDPSTDKLLLIRQPRYPPGMSLIFLSLGSRLEFKITISAQECTHA